MNLTENTCNTIKLNNLFKLDNIANDIANDYHIKSKDSNNKININYNTNNNNSINKKQLSSNLQYINNPEEEIRYEVQELIDKKEINGKIYYKVYWKGYPIEDSTWEEFENLFDCMQLINDYENKYKNNNNKRMLRERKKIDYKHNNFLNKFKNSKINKLYIYSKDSKKKVDFYNKNFIKKKKINKNTDKCNIKLENESKLNIKEEKQSNISNEDNLYKNKDSKNDSFKMKININSINNELINLNNSFNLTSPKHISNTKNIININNKDTSKNKKLDFNNTNECKNILINNKLYINNDRINCTDINKNNKILMLSNSSKISLDSQNNKKNENTITSNNFVFNKFNKKTSSSYNNIPVYSKTVYNINDLEIYSLFKTHKPKRIITLSDNIKMNRNLHDKEIFCLVELENVENNNFDNTFDNKDITIFLEKLSKLDFLYAYVSTYIFKYYYPITLVDFYEKYLRISNK